MGKHFLKKSFCYLSCTSFGIIPNLSKIKKIATKYNLKIIIDAACAFVINIIIRVYQNLLTL